MSDTATLNLRLDGDPDELIGMLFAHDNERRLLFGVAARSASAAELPDLEHGVVLFREIVMEAPVTYGLSVERGTEGLILGVHLRGSSRDKHIPGWILYSLKQRGLNVVDQSVPSD